MSAQSRPFTSAGSAVGSTPSPNASDPNWQDAAREGRDGQAWSTQNGSVNRDTSIGSLAKDLLHEVPALLTKELALAKSEMRETLTETKEGLLAVSGGGIVLMGGYIVLLFAAVYGLSLIMAPWLAALIVGGIAAVIGYIMMAAGLRQFRADNLRPDHTINSVRKDTDVIRGRTS